MKPFRTIIISVTLLLSQQIIMGQSLEEINEYFSSNSYSKVIELADKLLSRPDVPDETVHKAILKKGLAYIQLSHLDSAQNCFKQLADVENTTIRAQYFRGLGLILTQHGNYDSAEMYLAKAKGLVQESDVKHVEILTDLAVLYRFKGHYERAFDFDSQAMSLYNNSNLNHPRINFIIHQGLGKTYLKFWELHKAEQEFQLAKNIIEEKFGTDHPDLIHAYYGLSLVTAYLGRWEEAEKNISKYFELHVSDTPENSWAHLSAHNNIGRLCLQIKKYDLASEYLGKAYDIMMISFKDYTLARIVVAQNLGLTYYQQDQYDKASELLTESLEFAQEYYKGKSATITQVSNYLSFIESSKNNYDRALELINQGIQANTLIQKGKEFTEHTEYMSLLDLDHSIYSRAELRLLKFINNRDISELKSGLKDITMNLNILRRAQYDLSEDVRQELNEEIHDAHYLASDITFHLLQETKDDSYLSNIFNWMEQDKGNMLRAQLSREKAIELSGLSKQNLEFEKELKIRKEEIKSSLIEQQQQAEHDAELWNDLYEVQSSLDSFNITKEQFYSDKYDYVPRELTAVQSGLSSNEAYVEFLVRDDLTIRLVIAAEFAKVYRDTIPNLSEKAVAFRNRIANKEDLSDLDNELYNKLIADIILDLPTDINQLTIIPDGALHFLPFEVLKTNTQEKLHEKFLIHYDRYISNPNQNEVTKTGKILAMAPVFENFGSTQLAYRETVRAQFGALEGAMKEVNNIIEIFDNQVTFDKRSLESELKNNAQNYGIIHLATHAVANDDAPELSKLLLNPIDSLEDGYLHAHEIDNLDLNAELVTLSACNTGTGKMREGEGLLSLSYAFMLAGANNIVMSLWPVNDESTAELMSYFYQNLKEGQRKDEALRNAKLTYVENADPVKAHPYYWAGFVFTGDPRPIDFGTSKVINYWYFGLMGLLFFTVFFYKDRLIKLIQSPN